MPSCSVSAELITKIITVLVCILVMVASIITVVTFGKFSITRLFMSIYYILFAIILVLSEFKVIFILKKFRLLRYGLGKAIYSIILGLLMIQETDFGLNLACAITLVVLGIYYIVTMFICKSKQVQQGHVTQNSSRTAPLQTP